MATEKEQFLLKCNRVWRQIANIEEMLKELEGAYDDNGYKAAGSDPIVQTDLDDLFNFTPAEAKKGIDIFEALNKLLNNDNTVNIKDYMKDLNKLKFGLK